MQNDMQSRRAQMADMNKPSTGIRLAYNSKKLLIGLIGVIVLVLIVIFIGNQFESGLDMKDYYISDGYQSVFVTNGETYFGKVVDVNDEVLVLDNVYYLQDQQPLQSGPQPKESELALIKLGSEIHGPQNQMIIPVDSISFIENLKETSAIVRAIQKSE